MPSQAQQISEPAAVGEAKNIDLDPSSTSAQSSRTAATPGPAAAAEASASSATDATAPAAPTTSNNVPSVAKPNVDQNGMSATSGPLDDSIGEYGPGKASVDDADGSKFLEKERDLENDMPPEGDGNAEQGLSAAADETGLQAQQEKSAAPKT